MERLTRLLVFVLSFGMLCAVCLTVPSMVSFGETADVIEISTAKQLRGIGIDADKPLNGNYVLTADIDLSDEEWVGIGGLGTFVGGYVSGNYTYFNGTIDGRGHVISGMHYGSESEAKEIAELWGFVCTLGSNNASSPAVVKNIVFEDVFYNGYDAGTYTEVGVVAGFARYNVQIENVVVRSGKLIDNGSRQIRIGGIVGAMTQSSSPVSITNCYNGADITGNYVATTKPGYLSLGGIVGMQSKGSLTVDGCINAGLLQTDCAYSNTVGSSTSYSKICNLVSNSLANDTISTDTTITNCYVVGDCLASTAPEVSSLREGAGMTVLSLDAAAKASSYTNLSSSEWHLSDGTYPLPSTFSASQAISAVIGIDSVEALLKIGVDAAYPLSGSFRLTTDLDLTAVEWTPLGTLTGTFDGCGHVISNMHSGTASSPVVEKSYVWGLFGTVDGGTVKNLAFKNVAFYLNSAGGLSSLGTVCGYLPSTGGVIENVAVLSGTLHGKTTHQLGVGGLVGCTNKSSGIGFTIKNCYNGATVIAEANGGSYAVAAGIIGRAWSFSTRKIENCLNVGVIKAINTGAATTGLTMAGNIISYQGVTSNTVENNTVRINNFAIAGRLVAEGANSAVYQHDVETSATVVNDYNAISPTFFTGLTNGNSSAWTIKSAEDGKYYYPMLKSFQAYSEEIVVDEDASKAELNRLIDGITLSNHLTKEDVTTVLSSYFPDAQVTLTLNSKATLAAAGSWNLKVVLTDEISVERTLVIEQLPTVSQIDYNYASNQAGMAAGNINVTLSKDYAEGRCQFELYWGTSEGPLTGYTALSLPHKRSVNGAVVTHSLEERTVIPFGVTHLWVVIDGEQAGSYVIPNNRRSNFGREKYTFGILSDVHFGYAAAPGALTAALTHLESIGAKFATVAGDFTSHASQSEFDAFKETYNGKFTIPLFITLGNHDSLDWTISAGLTTETAVANMLANVETFANPNYTGPNGEFKVAVSPYYGGRYDYTVEYGDDLFVYLGIGPNEIEQGINNTGDEKYGGTAYVTENQLKWLDEVLDTSENYQNVILMFHYPTKDSGLPLYKETEAFQQLSDVLKGHDNVIHFSGHFHNAFDASNAPFHLSQTAWFTWTGTEYVASQTDLGYTAVHVPSLYDKQTGYIATVYESGTLLTGYDFANNQVIPYATFFVANEEESDNLKSENNDLTVNYKELTPAAKVYSLDMVWENDDVSFDYTGGKEGIWNPTNHTFEGVEDAKWLDQDLKVTVVNHSNAAVKATLTVADQDADDQLLVTPESAEQVLATAENTAVADAPKAEFTLTVNGTPTGDVDRITTVARATITLTAAE